MNPTLSKITNDDEIYKFTLSGVDVCIANAIRRIILSEIPINVIRTESHEINQCNIEINTTRLFHNEFIKHRLSCIPIHMKTLDILPSNYVLEVDVENTTENMIYVTTEHFKIRNKESGKEVTEQQLREIFPPCKKTNSYIEFLRLKPKISDTIPGERIKLTADFSISNAKENSMFNVVANCSFCNTMDPVKVDAAWEEIENSLLSKNTERSEIEFKKKNFYILDAQRYFIPNSFDFIINSIGIYENQELVKMACKILVDKFYDMIDNLNEDKVTIINSESTMDNCYDIYLDNEDYTMGKVLEYFLYEKYYKSRPREISYCGFKKIHPHNTDSIIRLAFVDAVSQVNIRSYLQSVCNDAIAIFTKIGEMF